MIHLFGHTAAITQIYISVAVTLLPVAAEAGDRKKNDNFFKNINIIEKKICGACCQSMLNTPYKTLSATGVMGSKF